jgi:hypothetical protein
MGLAIFTVGLAFVGFGAVPMVRVRRWRAQAFPALGRVVDNVPRLSRGGRTGWLPMIEFEAQGGSVRSPIAVAPARRGWPLGHPVNVLYDPANPSLVRPADAGPPIPWALIIGLAMLGGFFAVITT